MTCLRQVTSRPSIRACSARPASYAVRAAKVLSENIRRTLTGHALRRFSPQRDALYLVSTGGRHAIGTRNGLVVEGDWVWCWKDWIDRRFMARFKALPARDQPRG